MAPKRTPKRPGVRKPGIEAMIRVDHAGEHGAVRIYDGQLAVFGKREATKRAAATIQEMAAQEQAHLKTFDRLIAERNVRPTAFAPVWNAAGFALGAVTALMGEKAAMACTEAVEEVIDEHYAKQEAVLDDQELKRTVTKFRADEIRHRDTAIEHGAREAPGYALLSRAIKAGCRLAIRLSERI